ncbi:MAG TPA: dihydropteroate synthase [Vicinamibacterales bacterium]|nr:dihydropteroate synthase [Vicinamibacterales bacterium]
MPSARQAFSLNFPDGQTLALGARTLVMGILNVTPDSFADGGERVEPAAAIAAAIAMARAGADLIDLGGESTRPGADPLPAEEEWRRLAPVLEGLRGRIGTPVSVDTYKAVVAERAIALGAAMVNDVSALTLDPGMAGVVARHNVPVVLMHLRGRPRDMYAHAHYADVVGEVASELAARVRAAEAAGIPSSQIVVDPGLGFAKRAEHSLAVLGGLERLAVLGRPILVGPSRKSFLKAALGDVPASERAWGTAAAVTAAVLGGAHIVRVHDVAEMVQVVRVADAVRAAGL